MLLQATAARAWDSATHRAIARLAVEAMPSSSLKSFLARNHAALERRAVEPDSILKARYGKAEERRHYIDIEMFGSDPWTRLSPDITRMRRRTLERAGTLPWTIEGVSDQLERAWSGRNCAQVVVLSGHLAHYVGDASQPLHSTEHFDGYAGDRGVHARIEAAVDRSLSELEPLASREVHLEQIADVWAPTIAELHDANRLVGEVIRDDRAARDAGAYRGYEYQRALMDHDAAMFAGQIARAASLLGSIWLYEWQRAGSPAACQGQ